MLELVNVEVWYGSVRAIYEVNLKVEENEIVAVVGPNGAGKSTLLNTIAGILIPHKGGIMFRGEDVTFCSSTELVRKGIILVPEGRQLFGSLWVKENLFVGTYPRKGLNTEARERATEFAYELFPVLRERRKQRAMTLSGGEQQMLALGRGLVSKPRLILLDEPSLGLAPKVKKEIFEVLKDVRDKEGATILVAEQDARTSFGIADRGYLMQTGRIVLEGRADKLMESPEVRQIYFGKIQIRRWAGG